MLVSLIFMNIQALHYNPTIPLVLPTSSLPPTLLASHSHCLPPFLHPSLFPPPTSLSPSHPPTHLTLPPSCMTYPKLVPLSPWHSILPSCLPPSLPPTLPTSHPSHPTPIMSHPSKPRSRLY